MLILINILILDIVLDLMHEEIFEDNKKKDLLILVEDATDGLDDATLAAEK